MRIPAFIAVAIALSALAIAAIACGASESPRSSDADAVSPPQAAAAPTATTAPVIPTVPPPTAAPASETAPAAAPVPPPTAAPAPTATPAPEPSAVAIDYISAPELQKTGGWINSEPFTLERMREEGKVVLIDFWTYTCINCIRTLPYIKSWHDKYAERGLVILGVHTPEFEFEKVYENVVEAAGGFELEYPIVQDNDFGTWRAFNNRYWPAKYLIDHNGKIRYSHFGEGAYDETEMKIREILSEAGYEVGDVSASAQPSGEIVEEAFASNNVEESQTRELYAGFERNVGALRSMVTPPYVAHVEYYDAPDSDVLYQDPGDYRNHFLYLNGLWTNGHESLTHARETVDFEDYMALKFFGTSANAVMSPGEGGAVYEVRVYLNGAPVPTESAGGDILYDDDGNSYVAVDASRMYYLIDRDGFAGGELRLSSNSADFSVFAFTFGSYEGGEPVKG